MARDLKARYKNSVLGFGWCLGNPLLMMLVFTVVFSVLLRSNIPNFPVFLLAGLLPWNYTVSSVMGSVNSIVGNGNLIKKVYFPRELLPISLVLSNLVNFLLACIVLFALILVFRVGFSPMLVLFPVIMLMQTVFLIGLAMILSSINVYFRDTEVIVEVLVLAWFFLTPIFYRIEDLTAAYARLMYIFNPMASFISSYRLVLIYHAPPDPLFLLRTFLTSLAVLVVGYWLFSRLAPRFGEEI